jgi:hypothetical protein
MDENFRKYLKLRRRSDEADYAAFWAFILFALICALLVVRHISIGGF